MPKWLKSQVNFILTLLLVTGLSSGPVVAWAEGTNTATAIDCSTITVGSSSCTTQQDCLSKAAACYQDAADKETKASKNDAIAGTVFVAIGGTAMAIGFGSCWFFGACDWPLIIWGAAVVGMGELILAQGRGEQQKAAAFQQAADQTNVAISQLAGGTTSFSGGSSFPGGPSALDTTGASSGIQIDASLLQTGKLAGIMKGFTDKTGLSVQDLADAVRDGKDMEELLANSPKFAGHSEQIKDAFEKAKADGNPPSREDVLAKSGLTEADLLAGGTAVASADPGQGTGGKASGRTPASKGFDFSKLFENQEGNGGANAKSKSAGNAAVSPEVQSALDKDGISGRSIFDIVHNQYSKKSTEMLGVLKKDPFTREPSGTKSDPSLNGL